MAAGAGPVGAGDPSEGRDEVPWLQIPVGDESDSDPAAGELVAEVGCPVLTTYGPQLDVFALDMRSYRGPNTDNLQPAGRQRCGA